jgi:uncharacterized protein (TIGR02145 family)
MRHKILSTLPLLLILAGCGSDGTPTAPAPEAYKPILAEGEFTDTRDGNKYRWVRILAPHPGALPIDIMTSNLAWLGGEGDSVYRSEAIDSAASYKKWGVWYSWFTAVGGDTAVTSDGVMAVNRYKQGVCPEGWVIFNSWATEVIRNTFLIRWDPVAQNYKAFDESGNIYKQDTLAANLIRKSDGGTDDYGFSFNIEPVPALVAKKSDHRNIIRDTVMFGLGVGMSGKKYEAFALSKYDSLSSDSEMVYPRDRSYQYIRCVRGQQFE